MLAVDANVWVAAFDPHDRFHAGSVAVLRAVAETEVTLHGPAFLALEAACALARRAGRPQAGAAAKRLRAHPLLVPHALDAGLLRAAGEMGVEARLRASDALYAATARLVGAPLVSWDGELVERAGAITPSAWLAQARG